MILLAESSSKQTEYPDVPYDIRVDVLQASGHVRWHEGRNFVQAIPQVDDSRRCNTSISALPPPVVAKKIGGSPAPPHRRVAIRRTQAKRLKLGADDEKR